MSSGDGQAALTERLLAGASGDGRVADVRIGPLWTVVALETARGLGGGLASTQIAHDLEHGRPAVVDAGRLIGRSGREMARLALSASPTERSIGFAALNALLALDPPPTTERNAEEILLERGAGRRVAIIGHFPFVPRLREAAAECWVLELSPQPGDLPADRAPEVLPQADVVAITGMALVNGTFEGLAALCRPETYVVVLGATTPLAPALFDYGVDAISGTLLNDVPAALAAVSQGANFRQIPNKRLVMMLARPT